MDLQESSWNFVQFHGSGCHVQGLIQQSANLAPGHHVTAAHGPGSFVDFFVCEDAREQAWKDISIIAAQTSIYGFERLTETYYIPVEPHEAVAEVSKIGNL